ncbi:MAG: hypothetical protein IKY51_03930 [Alistipes sp.]|nr:hypothetical protein [Alistipes sp.]
MKRYIVTLLALLPCVAFAQVNYDAKRVVYNKQNVEVTFDVTSGEETLKNNTKMVLTPFLHNGADTLWLDSFEVFGSVKYKRERQEQALNGNKGWTLAANQIMEGEGYSFSTSTPYQSWMNGATLSVDRRVLGCGCDCYDGVEDLAKGLKPYNPPTQVLAEVESSVEHYQVVDAHKHYLLKDKHVIFPVSQTKLYLERYNNQQTLDEIIEAIKLIEACDEQQLNSIEMMGFASPEGTLKFNTELGEGRANALRNYIQSQMPHLKDEQFSIINGVENWDGLREMVVASELKDKGDVLDIIDTKSGEERKRALKQLNYGTTYIYMLKNFYPQLRKACYIAVYYDELADVAAADINKANELIRQNQPTEALEILKRHETDSRAWNSIGASMIMLERVEEAIYWLEKAIEAGSVEAMQNIKYLK